MENQQRKYRLVSRLHAGTRLAFWLFLALVLHNVYQDTTRALHNKVADEYYNRPSAYSLKVNMRLHEVSDSIINYVKTTYYRGSKTGFEQGTVTKNGNISSHSKKETAVIMNDTAFRKTIITHHARHHSPADKAVYDIEEVADFAEGYVYLNPKNNLFKVVLFVKNYAQPLVILLVLWLLMRLFKKLNDNFNFSYGMARSTLLIGYAILIYQLLIFCVDRLILIYFGKAGIMESYAGSPAREIYTLSPEGDANLVAVFLGLCLVALSKLLEYGSELQEENNLTI